MATWLITGANRGIGLALARHLSRRGERVIGTARAPGRAGDLRATASKLGSTEGVRSGGHYAYRASKAAATRPRSPRIRAPRT